MNFSPFSCPIFLGHPEASGFCFQSERLLYGREPNGVWAEPGKQKPRRCRAQELARSSGQGNAWHEKERRRSRQVLDRGLDMVTSQNGTQHDGYGIRAGKQP